MSNYDKCTKCGGDGEIPSPSELRWIRDDSGLSRVKFARSAGVSAEYIRLIENGERQLSPRMILAYLGLRGRRPILVHASWAEDEDALMARVAAVASGKAGNPERQEGGYDWRLDEHNDWWATLDGRKLTIDHRLPCRKLAAAIAFLRLDLA